MASATYGSSSSNGQYGSGSGSDTGSYGSDSGSYGSNDGSYGSSGSGSYGSSTGSYGSDTGSYGGSGTGTYGSQGGQPSSVPGGGWHCHESDDHGNGWDEAKCDKPPFNTGVTFGCTYHNGYGTGSNVCTYSADDGKCTNPSDQCPDQAMSDAEYRKMKRSAMPQTNTFGERAIPAHKRVVKKRSSQYAY
ncbi:hypothetical protein CYLTODRAFT_426801 [Cylindrobasidium torrendii FP15055 ss-10]|uniref:Uncharacterized protein n=1 Tax=Cylindrobasidium torrendii FP15055 ss-10 TaxID=1314674 RepID=A0A0D7AW12_9AGAR|nr:hypothetical protein CYLTODRAFT_426801 [Cylindrobasidium torrendii FP15055 ss-10]